MVYNLLLELSGLPEKFFTPVTKPPILFFLPLYPRFVPGMASAGELLMRRETGFTGTRAWISAIRGRTFFDYTDDVVVIYITF